MEITHGRNLKGVDRCPHCSIANPLLNRIWQSDDIIKYGSGEYGKIWAAYLCSSCRHVILAEGIPVTYKNISSVLEIYPSGKILDESIPNPARRYLEQAYESLHAPDAAAIVAGSSVDAMLKNKGYQKGSLYERINQAVKDNILTKNMGRWAHSVRLGSNRPRHSDDENPHVTPEEAQQSVEFVDALANFLFVLPARVNEGLKKSGDNDDLEDQI